MKQFALILATALLTAPALATPGGENDNSNCNGHGNANSSCDDWQPGGHGGIANTNTNTSSGGAGGAGGNSSASNNISNTSNSQSYYERETPLAPLLNTSDSAAMEGITVPLPTIGISGFYSNGDNYWNNSNRNDFGVTLGIRTPLGAGAFRDAAMRREKFQIVKEAIFLQEKGVLTYSAFPEHYIALHGAAPSPTDSAIK